jgi:serine/threonine-protein kinase
LVTRRLGRYHLVEPIGGGPTGEVHRARVYGVAGFERQFAVKRFHPEVVANQAIAAKLSAAARAYGGLEHPRIARLFEYGVAGGETFTACELVPGLDLAQLLSAASTGLPPGAAFSLIASAARAVGYAHGRGIQHLGLAPSNLIATPDGDVKVTDVGILAPRLPQRPSDDPALMWRLAYLAPEQLIGEPASAATDVFAFGVIAFELVTGQRAFLGATALDVEQAILSAQPREPSLPKPLLRVLQRCWARSPFERFPDARALADAVDAALRLAPVPGGKREIAALVREALDRIELVREQQLSGALNLPMPIAPGPKLRPPSTPPTDRVVVPPRAHTQSGGPPLARVVVPPIGAGAVPSPPRPLPRGSKPSRPPAGAQDDSTGEVTVTRSALDLALSTLNHDAEPTTPAPVPLAAVVSRSPGERSPVPARNPDAETTAVRDTSELVAQTAVADDEKSTNKMPPVELSRSLTFSEALEPDIEIERPLEPELGRSSRPEISEVVELDSGDLAAVATGSPPPIVPLRAPTATPPPIPVELPLPRKTPSALGQVEPEPEPAPAPPRRRPRRALWATVGVLLAGGATFAGVLAWQQWGSTSHADKPVSTHKLNPVFVIDGGGVARSAAAPDAATVAASAPVDAAPAVAPPDSDAATVAVATTDAAPAPAPTTGSAQERSSDGTTIVTSTPPGATVFVDGAEQGPTPLTLPMAHDKHAIAVVMAGYALYTKDIDGPQHVDAKLEEVTPTGGEAGIKVKCKTMQRYYVFVDGKPTGQLCPSERIHVTLGAHTVEVYDLVTEARTQYPVVLKDTEHSLRVKID